MNSIKADDTLNFFKNCEKSSNSILMLLDAAHNELGDEDVSINFKRGMSPEGSNFRLPNCLVLSFYHRTHRIGWQCFIEDENLTPEAMQGFARKFINEHVRDLLLERSKQGAEPVFDQALIDSSLAAANGDDPLEKP